ncbi:MAG: hypothetical protein K6T94_18430 [Paenibacillus sp.]|nr:hypothetical protein [Paenibacillus sp.]
MALDLNQQIFKTDTTTQSWGNVKGQYILTSRSDLRRGMNYELGVQAIAQINNVLNKWADLKILANAKVSALAQAQIQTPLDLFDEAGLAVRLQAVLEAAVAVGLSMDLTIGQLLDLIKAKPYGQGLSGELMELLMNETRLEAGLFGQYAVGFMAYANFVVLGSLHKTNEFPETGFQFVYDAGMGFIVGGGYRSYINLAMPNPSSLVYNFSNQLINGIVKKAMPSQRDQAVMLGSMLRIGVRSSYEVSDLLSGEANINPDEIAQKVFVIIWGQFQSIIFMHIGLFYRDEMVRILNLSGIPSGQTAQPIQILNAADVFQFPPYNHEVFSSLSSLASSIQDTQVKTDFIEALSALWVSAFFISSTLNPSEISQFPDYTGSLPTQFGPEIKSWINTSLNRGVDTDLNKADILSFLLSKPLSVVLPKVGNVQDIAKIVAPVFGNNTPQVVIQKLFSPQADLASVGSYRTLLSSMNKSFDNYVDREISGRTAAISNTLTGEQEIQSLFTQALVPGIQLVSDILLPEIANGFQNFDKKTLKEVFSSVLLTMIGRGVIHIVETIQSVVNNRIESILRNAVNNVTSVLLPLGAKDIVKKPLEEAIKIIADILAPLPQDVQNEIFRSAVNLVSPIEGNAVDYANRLKNDTRFMPQQDEIMRIAETLLKHLSGHMVDFAVKLIPALFQALIDALLALIESVLAALATILDRITDFIYKIVSDKLLDQLVGPFLDQAKRAADLLTFNIFDLIGAGEVKNAVFSALEGAVRNAVQNIVLPIVLLPLEQLKLDPRKVVDVFRGVTDFSYANFSKLFTNHLFSEIERQVSKGLNMRNIGIDLEVPVSFKIKIFGVEQKFSHTFSIADVMLPTSTVLNIIMKIIRDNFNLRLFGNYTGQMIENVQSVLDYYNQITQLQQDKLLALQKYGS